MKGEKRKEIINNPNVNTILFKKILLNDNDKKIIWFSLNNINSFKSLDSLFHFDLIYPLRNSKFRQSFLENQNE